MVLDKLTLFEVHLDGAQFGPKTMGDSDAADEDIEMETDTDLEIETEESDSGSSRGVLALLLGAVAVVGVVAWRRRSGEQTTMDDYADDEAEGGLTDSDTVEIDDVDA